jgi:acetyltransferase-like isoleucine patch superfamily enzyme
MNERLLGELRGGERLDADPDVLVAYLSARDSSTSLVLGADARLRSGTVLYAGTRIGDRFATGHHVVVREQCEIGDDVSVWSGSVVDYGCRLADGVKIHTNCYVAQHTELRAGAFLAPGVSFANDLYPGQADSARVMSGPVVGEEAQLGVNVTVLPYVRIGAGSIVGAGSVVTRDLPDGVVAYGSPAVVRGRVRDLTPIERRVVREDGSASFYRLADLDRRAGEVTRLQERGVG